MSGSIATRARSASTTPTTPSRARVALALGLVYLLWGSTYLGIKLASETIPPLLMLGVRYLIAGGVLYLWMRWRGADRPTRAQWLAGLVIAGLLLLVGNGAVGLAEQLIPTGVAALVVATVPLWMALLDWLRPGGTRPRALALLGLAFGFAGVVLLLGPAGLTGGARINPLGVIIVVVGAAAWAAGSLYSRSGRLPAIPLLATAVEMLAGGMLLVLAGSVAGEWSRFHVSAISTLSLLALAYLIVLGSLVGFTAYLWLMRNTPTAVASTYAFVNPIIAVFLGWALVGEPITSRTLIAAAVIVAGVVVITLSNRTPGARHAALLAAASEREPDREPAPSSASS
jgi:drug/metabolite transporter (DMT)-like permease